MRLYVRNRLFLLVKHNIRGDTNIINECFKLSIHVLKITPKSSSFKQ